MQEPQETQIRSLGQEDPLEEGMATHSSVLARRTPWTEEPGGLQSIESQRDTTEASSHAHDRKAKGALQGLCNEGTNSIHEDSIVMTESALKTPHSDIISLGLKYSDHGKEESQLHHKYEILTFVIIILSILSHFKDPLGNGNPIQCSCLENPKNNGAWWAAVYGVAQSWTRLK